MKKQITDREALEWTIKLWQYLADHPGVNNKREAMEQLDLSLDEYSGGWYEDCVLCVYCDYCDECLLKGVWADCDCGECDGSDAISCINCERSSCEPCRDICTGTHSWYEVWNTTEDDEVRKYNAQRLVDVAKEVLEGLNSDE
jgi:hypothetical protein